MTVLVLGATGQVGRHLAKVLPDARFWGREEADLAQPEAAARAVADAAPSVLVNVAAYTAVDQAEAEPVTAWRVNAEAPAALAIVAQRLGVPFIHLSTDYVFDGAQHEPYRTSDGARPLNVYGRSKLAGDLAVASLCERHWILRPSWVFSEYGRNFVTTMVSLAAKGQPLRVVDDQHGRPCCAGDVARVVSALLVRLDSAEAPASGTYHLGGGPVVSWYEFAGHIFRRALEVGMLSEPPAVSPISTADYGAIAARPAYSALQPDDEFQRLLGVAPDWQDAIVKVLERLRRAQP